MRRLSALAVGLLFVASVLAQAAGAASPALASAPTTPLVQKFVDSLLRIAEVQQAFVEGDVVKVESGGRAWHGTLRSGAVTLEAGDAPATHTLVVDPEALQSIINAYNMANTAKLAVKAQYMVARSERAAVMTAIGAVARTPLDERLPTKAPAVGESITFQGCTGTLAAYDQGRFLVTLCEDRYTVNALGGVTSQLPRAHLSQAPAGAGGDAPGEGDGESYGPDRDGYSECAKKVGPHGLGGRTAHRAWHSSMRSCLAGVR